MAEMELMDPSEMTAEERRNALTQAVASDDLLGVLLYLGDEEELNSTDATSGTTILQEAIARPTLNFRVRSFIVECILHRGATPTLASRNGHPGLRNLVEKWYRGGREQATASKKLLEIAGDDLNEAEEWLTDAGLGLEEEVDEKEAEIETPQEDLKKEEEVPSLDPAVKMDTEEEQSMIACPPKPVERSSEPAIPRPLGLPPRPPTPTQHHPAPTDAPIETFVVKVLHLPYSLPLHRFHDLVLENLHARHVVKIIITRDFPNGESVGHVIVDNKGSMLHLIDNLACPFEGRLLRVLAHSSTDEPAEDEIPEVRPPIPTPLLIAPERPLVDPSLRLVARKTTQGRAVLLHRFVPRHQNRDDVHSPLDLDTLSLHLVLLRTTLLPNFSRNHKLPMPSYNETSPEFVPSSKLSSDSLSMPLDAAPRPISASASTPRVFNRQVDVNVTFGFLPKSEALVALENHDPVYPQDPLLEKRYRSFLESQAGLSRDYYSIFFAQLVDWNMSSEAFAKRGAEEAERRKRADEVKPDGVMDSE
ncbi:uncharacterized protein JCM6883_002091 [Sporobolomyces salmoneus]|uniref:uncharacterized protein n=1 Tax=Sporobolomyces salmoneus TaxID=183962 RepID=UPI0031789B8A